MAGLLVLGTIAVYWPANRCGFINYDDDLYVTSNAHVQAGLSLGGIQWACLNPVASNWHPLTVLSHTLVWQVFGSNPWGHHLTNVLLHALNAGLVFWLFQRMTGARWRSLLVAALFAIHPLRVESVAWVAERKDVLSAGFALLTLIAYTCYVQLQSLKSKVQRLKSEVSSYVPETADHVTRFTLHAPRSTLHASIFYLLSLFFFALGLMSKPMLVTLPFVMLLLDYWPLGRMQNAECRIENGQTSDTLWVTRNTLLRLVGEKSPFFVLAALASVMTYVVQQHEGSLAAGQGLPLGARAGNALISYCRHLGKLFWPTDLAVFYPHPGYWPLGEVLLAGGVILAISVLLLLLRRRLSFLLVGWLWFIGMLVPVIGLVQTGGQALADRHSYLPSLGALILAGWGACELTRRWRYQRLAFSIAGCAAIVLCVALTRQQIGYWRDGEVLFRHALAVTERNDFAHNGLGVALDSKGQTDEAIHQFQEAIGLKPGDADAHNNLGVALSKVGQSDEAISQYREALRLKPDDAKAHFNLGTALGRKGQTEEAISQYQEAIRLKPNYAEAHSNLGVAFGRKGQTDDAIHQFQEAIRLKPGDANAYCNLGIALTRKGKLDEAVSALQTAIRFNPAHAEAHNKLGVALDRQKRTGEAIAQYREALRLKPQYAEAQNNLTRALNLTNAPAGR
jgi:protein O-mannosyl-transferase